jgi:hypothetical protein
VERLREACTDWNGTLMQDAEEPRVIPDCATLREAADRISTLERELEEARALNNKYAWERDKAREERDTAERRSEAYWRGRGTP